MCRSLPELLAHCHLSPEDLPKQQQASDDFPIKVTPHFLSLIEKGQPNDPLLLQVLPQPQELSQHAAFISDPLDEASFNPLPGLVHKYRSRVLLISNPSCAIHCRYCFRRHFDYAGNTPRQADWQQAADYIAADSAINEVILSGGDPLSSNDSQLAALIHKLEPLSQLTTLRIHSRIPVVMPERITDSLLSLLAGSRLKIVLVLHINHAQEIASELREACQLLQRAGVRLLNQSVLLRGVNDSLAAQTALCHSLHQADIQAYYLHLLDKVQGAEHFLVSDDQARQLYRQMQAALAGYMLPKLVRETAKQPHKSLLPV
ncbi:MAG: EF-P beta-lysylation protein EpmB [Pseudomonadales bacterium]|nr:EF-P beta-lysylation protein EpmB [Pseudomonadales bacterium]